MRGLSADKGWKPVWWSAIKLEKEPSLICLARPLAALGNSSALRQIAHWWECHRVTGYVNRPVRRRGILSGGLSLIAPGASRD